MSGNKIILPDNVVIRTRPPRFQMHCVPRGSMPDLMGAHACWYYYMIAQSAKEAVGTCIEDQASLGIEEQYPWRRTHYTQQKRSVANMYGITPDELDRFWPAVRQEIARWNALSSEDERLPEPHPDYVNANPNKAGH